MDAPTAEDVRRALAGFDAQQQKIVTGLLTAMMQHPASVRDREWISEQLTNVALLAGEFEADSPEAGIRAVQEFLQVHAADLLNATFLLFQRVGLDLAPRAAQGFTIEDALRVAVEYLPPVDEPASGDALPTTPPRPTERNLGEQPLARHMTEQGLTPHDLVAASTEQITHKMVTRAMKGRRLTANTMDKIHRAWNQATSSETTRVDLFSYEP